MESAPGPESSGAERAAWAMAQRPGVAGVVICDEAGVQLAAQTKGDAAREGALGAFVGSRGASLANDGDLRGMGRQLNGSHLLSITLAGPGGDYAALSFGEGSIFATMDRGASAERSLADLSAIAERYEQRPIDFAAYSSDLRRLAS